MQLRLYRPGRPAATIFGAVALGALLAGGAPQIPNLWDRPACAERIMQAVSSNRTVDGTFGCFDSSLQTGPQTIGVDSDKAFATRIGQDGQYHVVHKTADGGYIYEFDRPLRPHDRLKGAVTALGLPSTTIDVRRGDVGRAWNERHDLGAAWAEITGQTQRDHSQLFTFYINGGGKVTAVK